MPMFNGDWGRGGQSITFDQPFSTMQKPQNPFYGNSSTAQPIDPLTGQPVMQKPEFSPFEQANDDLAKQMKRGIYAPKTPVKNNYKGMAGDQVPINQEQRAANAKSNNASQMFMKDQPGIYEDANPEYGEPYQSMGEL